MANEGKMVEPMESRRGCQTGYDGLKLHKLCKTSLLALSRSLFSLSSHADGPPAFTEREREAARGWRWWWGVSLWETFVTSVTALLDGWAASIWLQCM